MNGKYILDKNRKPMEVEDVLVWAKWFETADRTIERTIIADIRVSTVFLGLVYRFGAGKPLLYETSVSGGNLDGETRRYATEEEAKEGHKEMVKKVKYHLDERETK